MRERVRKILSEIESAKLDEYIGYRELYGYWCGRNAAVPELRPLFRVPGILPDGELSVTDDFRAMVRSMAREIGPQFELPLRKKRVAP